MNQSIRNEQCRSPPQSTKVWRTALEQLSSRTSVPLLSPSRGKWAKTCAPPNRLRDLQHSTLLANPLSQDITLQDEMLQLIRLVLDNNTATLSSDTIRQATKQYTQAKRRDVECDSESTSSNVCDALQVSHLTQLTRKLVAAPAHSSDCVTGSLIDEDAMPSLSSVDDTSHVEPSTNHTNETSTFDSRIHVLRRRRTRLESTIRSNVSKFGNSMSSLDTNSLDDFQVGPVLVDRGLDSPIVTAAVDQGEGATPNYDITPQSRQRLRETLMRLRHEAEHVQRIHATIAAVEQQLVAAAASDTDWVTTPNDSEHVHPQLMDKSIRQESQRNLTDTTDECHPTSGNNGDGAIDEATLDRRWLFGFFHSLSFSDHSEASDHSCYMDWVEQAMARDAWVQLEYNPLDEPDDRMAWESDSDATDQDPHTLSSNTDKEPIDQSMLQTVQRLEVSEQVAHQLRDQLEVEHRDHVATEMALEEHRQMLVASQTMLTTARDMLERIQTACGVPDASAIPVHYASLQEQLSRAQTELNESQVDAQLLQLKVGDLERQRAQDQCTLADMKKKAHAEQTCQERLLEEAKASLGLRHSEASHLESAHQALNAELATKMVSLEEHQTEIATLENLLDQINTKIVQLEKDCRVDHVSDIPDKLSHMERELAQAQGELSRLQNTVTAMRSPTTSPTELKNLNEAFHAERSEWNQQLVAKTQSLEEHQRLLAESRKQLEQSHQTQRELERDCNVDHVSMIPSKLLLALAQHSTVEDLTTQVTLQLSRIDELEQQQNEYQATIAASKEESCAVEIRYSQLLDDTKTSLAARQADLKSLQTAFANESQNMKAELALKVTSLEEHNTRLVESQELLEQANQQLRQLEHDCAVDNVCAIPGLLSRALAQVSSLEKEIAVLTVQTDLSRAQQDVQPLQSRICELEQQYDESRASVSVLEEELRFTERRYSQMLDEAKASVETRDVALKSLKSERQETLSSLEEQTSKLAESQALFEHANQQLRQLECDCTVDDISAIPGKLSQALTQLSILENDLAILTIERGDLSRAQQDIQSLQSRTGELEQQHTEDQAHASALEDELRAAEAKYTKLLDEAKASVEAREVELNSLESVFACESEAMKAELAFKMLSLDEHKTKLADSQELLAQANHKLRQLESDCEVDDVAAIPDKLSNATNQLSRAETELAHAQGEIVRLQNDVKVLSAKVSLATSQAELKSLEGAFQAERQEWKEKLEIKNQSLDEQQRLLIASQEKVEQVQRTLRELERDCRVDSVSDIPSKLLSALEQLTSSENDLTQARTDILRLQHDVAVLNETNSVSHAHERATSFEKQFKDTERKLSKATTEIDSLKQTLARLYTKWESSAQNAIDGGDNDHSDVSSSHDSETLSARQLRIQLDQAQVELQYLIQTKLEQQSQYSQMQALQWDLEEERNYNRLKLAEFEKLVYLKPNPAALEVQLRETSLLFAEVQAGKDTLQLQLRRLQAASNVLQSEIDHKNKVIAVLGSRLELTPADYVETLQDEQDEMLRRATDLSVELAERHMELDALRERARHKATSDAERVVVAESLDAHRPVPSILSSFRVGIDFRR